MFVYDKITINDP